MWIRLAFEDVFGRIIRHTAHVQSEKEIDEILGRYQVEKVIERKILR